MSLFGLRSASAKEWLKVARSARVFSQPDAEAASKAVAKLPPPLRTRAEALFDEMARTPPTSAGLAAASQKLAAALPGFADPSSAYGGEEPNVATVKQASRALLHGLLARAGTAARTQPDPEAEALAQLSVVQGITMYTKAFTTSLVTELELALGDDLLRRAQKRPKPAKPAP